MDDHDTAAQINVVNQGTQSMLRRFVMITTPRSGSWMLLDILSHHPNISCKEELLYPGYTIEAFNTTTIPRKTLLNWLYNKMDSNFPEQTVGFKVHLEHLNYHNLTAADLHYTLEKPQLIILYRLNMLDIYVSREIACKTGVWVTRDVSAMVGVQVNVDWNKYLQYRDSIIADWLALKKTLDELDTKYIIVCYEDVVASRSKELRKIEKFLGVQEWSMYYTLTKQNPGELSEKVSNYADIAQYLSNKTLIEFDVKKLFDSNKD